MTVEELTREEAGPIDTYTPSQINSIFDKNYLPMRYKTKEITSSVSREMQIRRVGAFLLVPLIFEILAELLIPGISPIAIVLIIITSILVIGTFAMSRTKRLSSE